MESTIFSILVVILVECVRGDMCPKKCDCDMDNGLNRAICVDQNIISIEVGVPNAVQVYSLSHNAISELENFCFKEAGYLSLQILNLSYNLIFWIGLHAFAGLDQLTHLDLSNNRLRYMPSDLFWVTPRLTYIDLSSNIFETLKNEPFIMHPKLQVLNLNNCRMKALPERLFTRLPNLRKLDLSENYMVTLSTQVLFPLRKLERIQLRNEYWKCSSEFMDVESWIVSRGITYQKQCKKLAPKMSEKMISLVDEEKADVDVSQVWNITMPKNITVSVIEKKVLTPYEKFDKEFSSVQAFIIGVEIGLAIGIVGTYVWLRKFCHCGQLNCVQPQTRRQRRRAQRQDGDMRTNLLWSNVISPDLETPPTYRRELALPERGAPFAAYGVPPPAPGPGLPRAETPPPPYHECRISI